MFRAKGRLTPSNVVVREDPHRRKKRRSQREREQKAREEAEGKTNLESVPEDQKGEASESQPLLDSSGEPSGSKSNDKKDDDKMDTA